MRRKCLAIGVSRAEGLDPLHAAASAAEEICDWAYMSGFAEEDDIICLTDHKQDESVTVGRIRAAIEALLPKGQATDTFLLYFAGHGLREDVTRTLWLPTDWRSELRAVSVELLKNRLHEYKIANLTIISDACKSLPADRDTAQLCVDAVLGRGPAAGKRPIFDRFDAVHDFDAAFMIPGTTPEESRCLFSGALLEGLWGLDASAFDAAHPGKVTSGSLADYVDSRVNELCKTYRLQCDPQNSLGRPSDHLFYFDQSRPLKGVAPKQIDWPDPVKPQLAGCVIVKSLNSGGGRGSGWVERPADTRSALPQHKRTWLTTREVGAALREEQDMMSRKRDDRLAALFAGAAPDISYDHNLLLVGDKGARIWAQKPLLRHGDGRWSGEIAPAGEQILVEYATGVFVPAVIYPHLTTLVAYDDMGVAGWICVSPHGKARDLSLSLDIMNRFRNGDLPPASVDSIAAKLRSGKHINPVLGAISAYLYDFVGDIESIRRMGAFYVDHSQPVPFEIALLGGLETHEQAAQQVATVPAVSARSGKAGGELPTYVTAAMPGGEAMVAGRCPWLRQGWDFIDIDVPLVDPVLPELRGHLLSSTFTSLDRTGGLRLANHWKMEDWQ